MTAGTGPYWSIITPAERTNLISNPSVEFNLAGWGTTSVDAVIGRAAGRGAFGAYGIAISGVAGRSVKVNDGLAGSAIALPAFQQYAPYTLSAYVRATGSVALVAGDSALGTTMHSMAAGSSDSWMRLTTTLYPMTSVVYPRVVAWSGANAGTIFADGFQLEAGTVATTYFDGDQPGCRWLGQPHGAQSYRSGTTRSGGAVRRFYDIGLLIDESPGIGAPPAQMVARSNVLLAGAEFLRQRATERTFTLRGVVEGDSWAGLHRSRRRLIEALRIENTALQQPATLLYSGAGGTLRIDAVWDGGLEFGEPEGFAEQVEVRFNAQQPYWYNTIQQGTALAPYRLIGSVGNMLYRDRNGVWGTSGITALPESCPMLESPYDGTLYFAGQATTSAGSLLSGLLYLAGTTVGYAGSGSIQYSVFFDMAYSFDGRSILIGGENLIANGTPAGQLALFYPYTRTFGTAGWIAGTLNATFFGTIEIASQISAILPYKNGSYVLGGQFGTINGVGIGSAYSLILWNGQLGGWSTVSPAGSLVSYTSVSQNQPAGVNDIAAYGENELLLATNANQRGGVGTFRTLIRYNFGGTWGTIPSGPSVRASGVPQPTNTLFSADNQRWYFGWGGTSSAIGSALGRLENLAVSPVGTVQATGGFPFVQRIAPDNETLFWLTGDFNRINTITSVGVGIARSNGYNLLPADITGTMVGYPYRVLTTKAGTTWFSGDFQQTMGTAASLSTVVNAGLAEAYPTLRLVAGSTGTVTVRQLANITTGDYLWFALNLMPNERAILTLEPGSVSFTSSIRGNLFDTIVRGSNLSTWRLMPGSNLVSFLADQPNIQADLYWTPRYISADGSALQ